MSRLTRDGTAKLVSRDQILRHARGQGIIHFPCSADHEQDWQPYPVDPYSAICDDHTYIHTCDNSINQSRVYSLEHKQCYNIVIGKEKYICILHQVCRDILLTINKCIKLFVS